MAQANRITNYDAEEMKAPKIGLAYYPTFRTKGLFSDLLLFYDPPRNYKSLLLFNLVYFSKGDGNLMLF
jgi:hypothetical protein